MDNFINSSVEIIRCTLLQELKDRVRSAVLYGTAISDDFAPGSDFDVLVSFDDITSNDILLLRRVISICQERGVKIDFNVHSTDELPGQAQSDFWHNNRGLLFQKEIALFGKPILGPNPYTDYNPTSSQIEDDVVRSIGSLVYRARKILINKNLTHDQRYTIIKWVIYAASNALAYKGIFRNRKRDIINDFVVNFGAIGDVEKFLKYKLDPSLPIPDDVLFEALEILEKLSHYFFNERHSLG